MLSEELHHAAECWQWEDRTLYGLHLGIRGEVRFKNSDPRVATAMIVFCGLEGEDELHDHLARMDAGHESAARWPHVTTPSRFDATMRSRVAPVPLWRVFPSRWAETGTGCFQRVS